MNTVIAPGFDVRATIIMAMEFKALIIIANPPKYAVFDTHIDSLIPKKVWGPNVVCADKPWTKESRYKRKF